MLLKWKKISRAEKVARIATFCYLRTTKSTIRGRPQLQLTILADLPFFSFFVWDDLHFSKFTDIFSLALMLRQFVFDTARKVPEYGVFLVRVFSYSDQKNSVFGYFSSSVKCKKKDHEMNLIDTAQWNQLWNVICHYLIHVCGY